MTEDDAPLPPPNRLLSVALFLVAVAVTVGAYYYHTLPGQFVVFGAEIFIYLEGAARVMQGDLPNHDFSSPLGPALWVVPSIFLSETQIWLVLPVLLITATALISLLATVVLRPDNLAQFFVLIAIIAFCAVTLNAPSRFGDASDTLLWSGIYASMCSVIVLLLSAWVTINALSEPAPLTWPGAAIVGVSLFFLFVVSIPYFLAALLLLILAFRSLAQDFSRVLSAFVTPLVFITVLFPAMTIGYISDVIHEFGIALFDLTYLSTEATEFAEKYAISLAALFALCFLSCRAHPGRLSTLLLLGLLMVIVTLFVVVFDRGPMKSAPLLGLITGLTFALVSRPVWPLALLPLMILPLAIGQHAYTKGIAMQRNFMLASEVNTVIYNRFRIDQQDGLFDYTRTAEAAFAQLEREPSDACLVTNYWIADLTNPFGALLSRPGAMFETLWIENGVTVSSASEPSWEGTTGGADYVFVPKLPLSPDSTDFIAETFAEDLDAKLVIFENDGWTVYADETCI